MHVVSIVVIVFLVAAIEEVFRFEHIPQLHTAISMVFQERKQDNIIVEQSKNVLNRRHSIYLLGNSIHRSASESLGLCRPLAGFRCADEHRLGELLQNRKEEAYRTHARVEDENRAKHK